MPRASKTILVVDDDNSVRTVLATALRLEGYSVRESSSGRDGLKVIESDAIDLVISDVQMDDGDGIFLIQELQRLTASPRVILMTGDERVFEKGAEIYGAADLVAKPIDWDLLLDKIEASLS